MTEGRGPAGLSEDHQPIARSPVRPGPPVTLLAGWEVSARRSTADLRLADLTPLAKVLVRADLGGPLDAALGAPRGRAARHPSGALVARLGPDEWLLLGPPGTAAGLSDWLAGLPSEGLVSVVDVTHGRALLRLTGRAASQVLAAVCGVPLDDAAMPDGSASRTVVAAVATDLVRDDQAGVRSYLLGCERSSGQYLFDALLDAGSEHGIDADGFADDALPGPPT